jgi:hypothetical protein
MLSADKAALDDRVSPGFAGTILQGGVVALTQPRPISPFDPDKAAAWARDGRLLLLLEVSANLTISARSRGRRHSLGCRGSCCPTIRRRLCCQRRATASPRAASNMSSSIAGCASSRLSESCFAAMWWSARWSKVVSRSQRYGDRSVHSPWCWVTKRRGTQACEQGMRRDRHDPWVRVGPIAQRGRQHGNPHFRHDRGT